MTVAPSLPYAGTSGYVPVDTSRARALHNDGTGKTNVTQQFILTYAEGVGEEGLTVKEVRENPYFQGHHGDASGSLTVLHKVGRLACLTEKRDGSHVYVLPENTAGRSTREYAPISKIKPPTEQEISALLAVMRAAKGHVSDEEFQLALTYLRSTQEK